MNMVTFDVDYLHVFEVCNRTMKDFIATAKRTVVNIYETSREKFLFTFTFQLPDHVVEDIIRFRSEKYLDISAFEHLNNAIKRPFRTYSIWNATRMPKTVKIKGRVL